MVASFTVSQDPIDPAKVTVADTSTSVTGSITQRRVTITNAYATALTGNGTVTWTYWPLADSSIPLSILTEDIGANVLVQWLDISNNVVTSLNNNFPLSEFNKQFVVQLVAAQGLTPGIYQDANYKGNLGEIWANIKAGDNAVTYGNNIAAAQNCYNRATFMRLNQSDFF